MKVWRKTKTETSRLQVGDQIEINLKNFGKHTVTVHKVTGSRALLMFDEYVAERPMNKTNTNEGGFLKSDLCKWLNCEFLGAMPDQIRSMLVKDDAHGGLMIRIPTHGEMFGKDAYSDDFEPDSDAQLPLMEDRKNRISTSPKDGHCWYWLTNARLVSVTCFAIVGGYGGPSYDASFPSLGVRPVFEIDSTEEELTWKVWRKTETETSRLQVGDQIELNLKGYLKSFGKHAVTVHKVDGNKALLMFDNCVAYRHMNVNDSNEGGFEKSELCKWLQDEFLGAMPDQIRSMLVKDDAHGGLMIRIPTYGEMFGKDVYSVKYTPDSDTQLPLMKNCRYRVCQSPHDEYCMYWLMSAKLDLESCFATVKENGHMIYARAFGPCGVRPVFEIELTDSTEE